MLYALVSNFSTLITLHHPFFCGSLYQGTAKVVCISIFILLY